MAHKLLCAAVTFVLVDFSWIFFRADGFGDALEILRSMATVHNPWVLFDGSLYTCGLDEKNFRLMLLSVLVLLAADVCKRKGIQIRKIILRQDGWARCLTVTGAVLLLLIFGKYGPAYDAANFIYFQF